MATGVDANRKQSLPVSKSYIAQALTAHHTYLEAIDRWQNWLERDDNANTVILHTLISNMIRWRSPGGQLADANILSSAEMEDCLDKAKYDKFRTEVKSRRDPIEQRCLKLIEIMQSVEFLRELDALPFDEQVIYAEKLAAGFSYCTVGLTFQVMSIKAGPQSPLPFFSVERFLGQPGDFDSQKFPVMYRSAGPLTHYLIEISKALVVDENYELYKTVVRQFLEKWFPPEFFNDVQDTGLLLEKVRNIHKANPTIFEDIAPRVGARLMIFVEIAQIVVSARLLRDNPNQRNAYDFLSSLADARLALAEAQKILKISDVLATGAKRMVFLYAITGVYDVVTNLLDASKAWNTGDLSVAVGHSMQAVGLGAATAISVTAALGQIGAIGSVGTLAGPGGVLLVLGFLLVTVGGTLVVYVTRDAPIEQWFKRNYFGKYWAGVEPDPDPDDITFRWRPFGGKPNITRQISDFLSMLFPIGLTVERVEDEDEEKLVKIRLTPTLAYHGSEIYVKHIFKKTDFNNEKDWYWLRHVYRKPLNATDDRFPGGAPRNKFAPFNPQKGERFQEWSRLFYPLDFALERTPDFDPSGSYIEVDLTIPDEFGSQLTSLLQQNADLMDRFPFILRQRIRIP
jgi:hypothetical protein